MAERQEFGGGSGEGYNCPYSCVCMATTLVLLRCHIIEHRGDKWAKSGPLSAFVNKALLEHNLMPSHLPIVYGSFCTAGVAWSSCDRDYDLFKSIYTVRRLTGSLLTLDNVRAKFSRMLHL